MKILLSTLLLLLSSVSSEAQTQQSAGSKLEESLYYRALLAMVAEHVKDAAKFPDLKGPSDRVIIERDIQLNTDFPARINETKVAYLYPEDLRKLYLSRKQSIPFYVMRPMRNEGHRLVIDFTRYWFSATKKTHLRGLEGGYRVWFVYDSSERKFVIERTELWGI